MAFRSLFSGRLSATLESAPFPFGSKTSQGAGGEKEPFSWVESTLAPSGSEVNWYAIGRLCFSLPICPTVTTGCACRCWKENPPFPGSIGSCLWALPSIWAR